jgi:hypothetical protein
MNSFAERLSTVRLLVESGIVLRSFVSGPPCGGPLPRQGLGGAPPEPAYD